MQGDILLCVQMKGDNMQGQLLQGLRKPVVWWDGESKCVEVLGRKFTEMWVHPHRWERKSKQLRDWAQTVLGTHEYMKVVSKAAGSTVKKVVRAEEYLLSVDHPQGGAHHVIRPRTEVVEVPDIRAVNKALCERFGCSVAKAYKHFRALQWKVFAAHIPKDLLLEYAYDYPSKKLSVRKLKRLDAMLPTLLQMRKDGQEHLIPIAMKLGNDPKGLRERFGKGLWKTLCKNSKHRNKILAPYLSTFSLAVAQPQNSVDRAAREAMVRAPSMLLKLLYRSAMGGNNINHVGQWEWLASVMHRRLTRVGRYEFNHTLTLRRGVETMCASLTEQQVVFHTSLRFTGKETYPELMEKHRRLQEITNANRPAQTYWGLSAPAEIEHYPWVEELCPHWCFKDKEGNVWEAKPLTTRASVKEEGVEMHHCVGGYSSSVAKKRYVVYSILKNGKRSSTLGLRVDILGEKRTGITLNGWITVVDKVMFDQHYKAYDKEVVDEVEKKMAQSVLSFVQNSFKESGNEL